MRQIALPFLFTFALVACDDASEPQTPQTYAGVHASDGIGIFPSDLYTISDTTTFTGLRLNVGLDDDPMLVGGGKAAVRIVERLKELDGFGTSAGGWFALSDEFDAESAKQHGAVLFGYFEGDTPILVPSEIITSRMQVAVRPDFPLPPNTVGFLVGTTRIEDVNGKPVAIDPNLAAILKGKPPLTDEISADLATRLHTAAAKLIEAGHISSLDTIAALSVFTTQSIHETDLEVAARIASEEHPPTVEGPCENETYYRRCTFTYEATNFVGDDRIIPDVADGATARYTMRAHAFLPLEDAALTIGKDNERGYAVSIFGHGLTGAADQAGEIARYTAPFGMATLAIDAPQHGEHPTRIPTEDDLAQIMNLFGIVKDGSNIYIDPFLLRDGWRHSNFDKLALLRTLEAGVDFDGDGAPDLDIERLSYLGGSLGAIQGSEFLALTDMPVAGMYAVGGARLSDFLRFGTILGLVNTLLFNKGGDAAKMRVLVLLQTGVEKGDGGNWAGHILQNRLVGERIPNIAMQISVPDEVVPSETGMYLARVIGAPLIGRVAMPDPHLETAQAPLAANHPSGKTVGLLQTDWLWRESDQTYIKSSHAKSAAGIEGIAYWSHAFLTLFGETGTMELIDPYALPSAPPRP